MNEQLEQVTDEQKAREMIQAVYLSGDAEINGRHYIFNKMTHKQRRKVFAYYTKVAPYVKRQDFSFLDDPAFADVEDVINNVVSYEGSLLSRLGDRHWELYPADYLTFLGVALPVISYPFFPENSTG